MSGLPMNQDRDPWYWTVEDVVTSLCDANGFLKKQDPTSQHQPSNLAPLLRAHQICGSIFLTKIDDVCLRNDLGVFSIGERGFIEITITRLRDQSFKYREHMQATINTMTTPVASYGVPSSFNPASVYNPGVHLMHNPYTNSMMNPPITSVMSRFLLEPIYSPDRIRRSIHALHGETAIRTPTSEHGYTVQIQTTHAAPQKPDSDLAKEHHYINSRSPSHQADGAIMNAQEGGIHGSDIAHSGALDDPVIPADARMLETHIESEPSLRRGENYVVDGLGRKRRRLQLTQLNLEPKSEEPKISVGGAQVPAQETLAKNHNFITPPFEVSIQESQEPGQITLDPQGRKRMRPILVSQLSAVQNGQKELPRDQADKQDNQLASSPIVLMSHKSSALPDPEKSQTKRDSHNMYLGPDHLSIDEIFYGDTPMNQEVKFDNLDPVSGQFSFQSDNRTCTGRQIYIHNRIKHFLFAAELESSQRNDQVLTSIMPYPDRIAKKHQRLSLTVLKESTSGIKAYRVDRSKWFKHIRSNGNGNGHSQNANTQGGLFGLAENGSLLDQLGGNEPLDWDILEKWKYQDSASEVLPLYGDSGSENEFDLNLWREIEEERGALARPLASTKRNKISPEEVNIAIDEASEQMLEDWISNKLPRLEHTAWRIWKRSRRDRTKRDQIDYLSQAIGKLNVRLAKIRKELIGEVWSSVAQVKKQCQCMQASIFDRENHLWKIQILGMCSMPKKPLLPNERPKTRKPQSLPVSLEEGEEDLTTNPDTHSVSTDNSLADFIDDDDLDNPLLVDDKLNHASVSDEGDDVWDEIDPNSTVRASSRVYTDDYVEVKPDAKTRPLHRHSSSISSVKDTAVEEKASSLALDADTLGSLSELSSTPELTPEPVLPMVPRITGPLAEYPDLIDLTQRSSSIGPESPKLKLERHRIETPPLYPPDENPFARNRRGQGEFIIPPMPPNIIDLDTGSTRSEDSETIPPPKKLPELWEVQKIGKLDPKDLQYQQDRKRLLIWIICNMPSANRKRMIAQTRGQSLAEMQVTIWDCMNRMKAHSQRLRGLDQADSSGFMRLACFYITWSQCKLFEEGNGVPVKCIDNAQEDEEGFEPFYRFLKESLKHYQESQSTLSISKTRRKKDGNQGKFEDSSDESLNASRPNSTKKRKSKVSESQEALLMRQNALDRARDYKRRSKLMEARLRGLGVNSQDISTMAVNLGVSTAQHLIGLNPEIGSRIQPHQAEGVRFMWAEIVNMQGCLLAHTMGLGKTMQVITLLTTIAEASKSPTEGTQDQIPKALRESQTLVLCPPSLIDNWYDEFLMWTPKPQSNNVGEIHKVNSSITLPDRLYEIQEWSDNGGVLLIGYSTFRDLVSNKARKGTEERPLNDEQHRNVLKHLLERPNIVVADEAHAMKSQTTEITQATKRLRTRCRIALTGSPLANNLEEYFAIIDWISPRYLGDLTEFRKKYVEPIKEGLFRESSPYERRKGLKMLEVLKRQLQPKVHRADISVLKGRLKGKTEFVIRVPLTKVQKRAYEIFVEHMLASNKSNEPVTQLFLVWLSLLRLLCNHPKCFIDKLNEPKKELKNRNTRRSEPTKTIAFQGEDLEAAAESLMEAPVSELGLPEEMLAAQRCLFENLEQNITSIQLAHKMKLLMQILNFSEEAGDKVLVFSHSIPTLDYIEQVLRTSKRNYRRLDGRTKMTIRSDLIKDFNNGKSTVCLISTRAGGQGLNLIGANRVVIIDDNFNPMHEEQAIGRAYRIGQQKYVYVYRLIVGGSFEEALQNQSLFKLQLATRVVDKKNPMRNASKGVRQYLFPPKDVEQKDITQYCGKDELVLDRIIANEEELSIVRSIDLSETLHQEIFEELTAEEKREVKEMEDDEMLRRTDPAAYQIRLAQREREKFLQQKQIFHTLRAEEMQGTNHTDSSNLLQKQLEHEASSGGLEPILPNRSPLPPAEHDISSNIFRSTSTVVEGSNKAASLPISTPDLVHMKSTDGINHASPTIKSNTSAKSKSLDIRSEPELSAIDDLLSRELAIIRSGPTSLDGEARNETTSRSLLSISNASRTGSEIPSDARSLVSRDGRNAAREQISIAISDRLPLLSKRGLFFSAHGDETCRVVAKLLERLTLKQAKNEADYRESIDTHISTCQKDNVFLSNLLKQGEAKRKSNLTSSRTVPRANLTESFKNGGTNVAGDSLSHMHSDHSRLSATKSLSTNTKTSDADMTKVSKESTPAGSVRVSGVHRDQHKGMISSPGSRFSKGDFSFSSPARTAQSRKQA